MSVLSLFLTLHFDDSRFSVEDDVGILSPFALAVFLLHGGRRCKEQVPLHMESDRGRCFPDDLRIIKGAIMMAITLLGHLLSCVFVLSLNCVTAWSRTSCAFVLRILGGNVCFPLKETPTSGILCDERFMVIVSSIERETSFSYYYVYLPPNSSKCLCWSLGLLLNWFSVLPALICIVEIPLVNLHYFSWLSQPQGWLGLAALVLSSFHLPCAVWLFCSSFIKMF